jgi:hypothetical protein
MAGILDFDKYFLQFQSVATLEPGTMNLEPIRLGKNILDLFSPMWQNNRLEGRRLS